MEFLYLIIGIVIGFGIAYFLQQSKKKSVEAELMLARQQMDNEQQSKVELQTKLSMSDKETDDLQGELTTAKMSISALQAQLKAEQMQHQEEAELRREQQTKLEEQRQQQFNAQLETVKEQLKNLAAQVLDQSADRLKIQNTESIAVLTAPLKDNISKLHEAIFKTNQETAKSTSSLSEQLRAMAEQTQDRKSVV